MPRIGIFLNLFDVHVARAPIGGRVAALRYTKGRFVNASLDKASERQRAAGDPHRPGRRARGRLRADRRAGGPAHRLRLYEGQQLAAGERIGIIRFGSRVDVYCPPPYVPLVVLGQRMVAGETVLADRLAQEPPRKGFSH